MENYVTLSVPAFKTSYGIYDAAQNAFVDIVTITHLDKNYVPDILNPSHELLRQQKVRVATKMPLEIVNQYIVKE